MRELTHEEFELVAGGLYDYTQNNNVYGNWQYNEQDGGDSHNTNNVTAQSGGWNYGNNAVNIGNFKG